MPTVAKHTGTTPPDLNDVRTFVAMAETHTLSDAAKKLSVPPSTISRSLTRLERRLGIVLVQRSARGFLLTDVGRGYLAVCQRALHTLTEGEIWIDGQRSQPSGRLKIACPVTFARSVLAPVLGEFFTRFPDIRVHIETFASSFDYTPADDIDVFFKIRAPQDSPRRIRCYPGNALALFASKAYLERFSAPRTPADLGAHACVGMGPWCLSSNGRTCTPNLSFAVETRDPHIDLTLVLQGVGIGVLPLWMAGWPDVRDQVVPVLPEWNLEPHSISALFFGPSGQTPKVQALLNFLDEYIGTEKDPRLKQTWTDDLFPTSDSKRGAKASPPRLKS